VYVFTRSSGAWKEAQRLTAQDGAANDQFGFSTAVSADGGTIAAGAYGKATLLSTFQGAVYVFTRDGTTWKQAQKLAASDGAGNDCFGFSTAVSADGSVVVGGANYKSSGGNEKQGAAYVFTRSGTSWSQAQKLLASDGAANDNFGASVSISADGSVIAAGASWKKVGANGYQGAVYLFSRSGASWSQAQKLLAADGAAGDNFGASVSVSADGGTIAVGANAKSSGGVSKHGVAYVLTRSGREWSQAHVLRAPDAAANDQFGVSVSAARDAAVVVFGALNKAVGQNSAQGAAQVY
jgi:uncharacterized RmlC-like cupin family protein